MRTTLLCAAVLLVTGCAFDDEDLAARDGDDIGQVEEAVTTVLVEDFEGYAPGPLGSPWQLLGGGGATTTTVVDTGTLNHRQALLLHGGAAQGQYIIMGRVISATANVVRARVDLRPASGAAFLWILKGAGSSIGRRRIRLQRAPGSSMLAANTVPAGTVECGPLPSGAWSRVRLTVDARRWPHTFDVLIDGQPTACTDLETGLSPPFNGVQVMDASNEGWGGDVLFDNIVVTTP